MSADEKVEVLERVEASPGSRRKIMAELGVPKSTYYRWRARPSQDTVEDRSDRNRPWNSLTPGLTGIQEPIHWPATQDSGGSELDEMDRIAIENFLDTLAEIAIKAVTRESAEHEAQDE